MPLTKTDSGQWTPDGHAGSAALDEYVERVARRLRLARNSRRLTRAAAAAALEGVDVSQATLKNYEAPRGHSQLRLSIVVALATAYGYDAQAVLAVDAYDDDEAALASGQLEPVCGGWLTCNESPGASDGSWRIYEQRGGLALIVMSPARGGGTRRIVVTGDARHAYDILCEIAFLEAAGRLGMGADDIPEEARGRELLVDFWHDADEPDGRDDLGPEPSSFHRRRRAAEAATLATLGSGWEYHESDGERRPFLRLDAHHDVELVGFGPEGECTVCLWYVPDYSDPDVAAEVGTVTNVPAEGRSVRQAIGHLRDWCRDVGRYEISWAELIAIG